MSTPRPRRGSSRTQRNPHAIGREPVLPLSKDSPADGLFDSVSGYPTSAANLDIGPLTERRFEFRGFHPLKKTPKNPVTDSRDGARKPASCCRASID